MQVVARQVVARIWLYCDQGAGSHRPNVLVHVIMVAIMTIMTTDDYTMLHFLSI